MSILTSIKSLWTKPASPHSSSSCSASPSPPPLLALDHHGALDIPEIVRHVIILVLSHESQPRLLHSSQRTPRSKRRRRSPALSSSNKHKLQPHLQPPPPPPKDNGYLHHHRAATSPSSVRLVSRLWYAVWLNVRLGQQAWTLGETAFDIDAALEAMHRMSGRQRIVIQPSPALTQLSRSVRGVVDDARYSVAIMSLAVQFTQRSLEQLMLQDEQQTPSSRLIQPLQARNHRHSRGIMGGDATMAVAPAVVVKELCLKRGPSWVKADAIAVLFQNPLFSHITLLDLSFTYLADFDIQSLFHVEAFLSSSSSLSTRPPHKDFYFQSLQHLLLRNVQLAPIFSYMPRACPAARNLVTLVLDGVLAPVSTLRDLIRLFRTPTLKRVHVSRPMGTQAFDEFFENDHHGTGDDGHMSSYTNALLFSPSNSFEGIIDEMTQHHLHHTSPSSYLPPPPPPQYESLGLELLNSREYQMASATDLGEENDQYCHSHEINGHDDENIPYAAEWSEVVPLESTLASFYSHLIQRHRPTEQRLAAYLQSEASKGLRELHAPSIAYEVRPFIDHFMTGSSTPAPPPPIPPRPSRSFTAGSSAGHHDLPGYRGGAGTGAGGGGGEVAGEREAAGGSAMHSHRMSVRHHPPPPAYTESPTVHPTLLRGQAQFSWHCRNLRRLVLSFLSSSAEQSICVLSSRELFGFLSYNCPQIEELDLQSRWMLLSWDSGLCLTSRWRRLRHLVLRGCSLGCESPRISEAMEQKRRDYERRWYYERGQQQQRPPPPPRAQQALTSTWLPSSFSLPSSPSAAASSSSFFTSSFASLSSLTLPPFPSPLFDHEWLVQHPTKDLVQQRRTSRAMCRALLRLPPFSPARVDQPPSSAHRGRRSDQRGDDNDEDDGERATGRGGKEATEPTMILCYGAFEPVEPDDRDYEPGSLASALESILDLEPAIVTTPPRSTPTKTTTGAKTRATTETATASNSLAPPTPIRPSLTPSSSPSSSSSSSPSSPSSPSSTPFAVDRREGAQWESLETVRIVTEGFTHSNWEQSQMPWKEFAHVWHHLRPDVDVQFTFGRNTAPLFRNPGSTHF
ncbi:hypothetical protein BGZ73_005610 [Actinomortierella ambigua]|nr:hypothetical protein BGZ73_005610 [Actinomortierella ambigua]